MATEKSSDIRSTVCKFANKKIATLANDPYSSRVLQAIVKKDENFRAYCLTKINLCWDTLTNSVPAIFLLSSCLEHTSNKDRGFISIGRTLYKRCTKYNETMPKHLKRTLVSYLEYCDQKELDSFFELLDMKSNLIGRMDDKYMVYILNTFLTRQFEPSVSMLMLAIESNLLDLLATVHFPVITDRLFNNPLTPQKTRKDFSELIMKMLDNTIRTNSNILNTLSFQIQRKFIHTLYTSTSSEQLI